ncbi:3517_t:CDS:1 [Ambispora leptoticha]|uniref:3517_t:CDS:1 n=1 Tax=Ambispora leptoticha TaxID=144679 RepID=A0A9N9AXY4_9GLOM|nr:3517_t:CDS:1 [Ambispora leptoticha]
MNMKTNTINNKRLPKIEITVSFPPDIVPINLINRALEKTRRTGKYARVPNAFIAYRSVFCKELQKTIHPIITQPQLSLITREYWSKEPENVRREYERIAAEARNLYIRICIEQKLFQETKVNKNNEKGDSYSYWSKQHSEFAHDPNSWQISPQTNEIEFSESINNGLLENFIVDESHTTSNFIDTTFFNPPIENNQFLNIESNFLSVFSDDNLTFLSNTPPSAECCDSCKKYTEYLEKRISDLEVRLNDLTEKYKKSN